MIKAYDLAVKKLIEVFANKIPVLGFADSTSSGINSDLANQLGVNSKEDKLSLPVISVFRNPDLEIVDGSISKRPSTSLGYLVNVNDDFNRAQSLVTMRSNLSYTVDVFDVTRASAEEVALKLYFRLRNNPELKVNFNFKEFNHSEECIPEIQLKSNITNQRLDKESQGQAYMIRFSFNLVNVNIFDILDKEIPNTLEYTIDVKLSK